MFVRATALLACFSLTLSLTLAPVAFCGNKKDLVREGQILSIQVDGEKDLTGQFKVKEDGQIEYPLLGEVYVDGLNVTEIRDFLKESLEQSYLVNPVVTVGIGSLPVSPPLTLAEAAARPTTSKPVALLQKEKPKEKEKAKEKEKQKSPTTGVKGSVIVEVEGEKDFSGSFGVDEKGQIDYPYIGKVKVEGLNSEQIRSLLVKSLEADYLVSPVVSVQWVKPAKKTAEDIATDKVNRDLDFKMNLIRIGDKLNIQVLNEKDLSQIYLVGTNGKIKFPLIGDIYVEGLLVDELALFLADNLKSYLVDPKIEISFEESLNKALAILGPVAKPGNYNLTPDMTLIRLVSEAGGFTAEASGNAIRIRRTSRDGQEKVIDVDFAAMLAGKIPDMKLEPNDIVYVQDNRSAGASVSVLGQVVKPGNYTPSGEMTLVRLISQAGGFTPVAAAGRVRIVRSIPGSLKKKTIQVSANSILDGRSEDVKIEPGDIIVVPESFF